MNRLAFMYFLISYSAIFMVSFSLSMNKMPLKIPQIQKSAELIHTIDALKYEKPIENENNSLNFRISKKNKDNNAKTLFGFTIMSEVINGRVAMLAVVFGLVNEMLSGKSLLAQIGLNTQIEQATFTLLLLMTIVLSAGNSLIMKKAKT